MELFPQVLVEPTARSPLAPGLSTTVDVRSLGGAHRPFTAGSRSKGKSYQSSTVEPTARSPLAPGHALPHERTTNVEPDVFRCRARRRGERTP